MIFVVQEPDYQLAAPYLRRMFQMRAEVFSDELGWDVIVDRRGEERDRYDQLGPVYFLLVDDETGQLLGSQRLLPTTGPTLLTDTFNGTVPADMDLEAPSIWECTRTCLDPKLSGDVELQESAKLALASLVYSIGELGLQHGIDTVVANFVPGMLRLYRRLGCKIDVLGRSDEFGEPVLLGAFTLSQSVLNEVQGRSGLPSEIIEYDLRVMERLQQNLSFSTFTPSIAADTRHELGGLAAAI